jgi:hypothetical protein
MAAPLGSFLAAWVFVRGFASWSPALTWIAAGIFAVTPWLCTPLSGIGPEWIRQDPLIRSELPVLYNEVFKARKDPNRIVVEWLKENAKPDDEILINYEDIPLMYYLPNPIRGGVAAFRVGDDSKSLPQFAILRGSVPFVHWPVFLRQMERYQWEPVSLGAPDVIWGNNPDPMGKAQDPAVAKNIYIARRLGSKTP